MRATPEQQQIIDAPCGNILVSAAAGSGKTTVMTERIVSRIVSGKASVDHILVMTFTNAAAANMSAKLEQKLRERLAQETDPEIRYRLNEQLAALPSAYISTIDSFCSKVITSFAASARDEQGQLFLEPGSKILDENHGKNMLRESFDDVFEKAYLLAGKVQMDESLASEEMCGQDTLWPWVVVDTGLTRKEWARQFLAMTEAFGSGRDDTSLKEDMMDKLSYLRSLPQYRQWITENLAKKRREIEDPTSASWAKKVMKLIREITSERIDAVRNCLNQVDQVIFVKKEKDNLLRQQDMKEWLCYLKETGEKILDMESISWKEMVELGKRCPSCELKFSSSVKSDESLQKFAVDMIPVFELLYCYTGIEIGKGKLKTFTSHFRFFFGKSKEELKQEAEDTYACMARYFEIVLAADAQYTFKKREEQALDFADQEQMALVLLSKEEVSGYYRDLFTEIYIDEYQDNSGVQDAIVASFAKDNVFFVGDVKQSIYRFRHAKPQLFLERYKAYSPRTGEEQPGKLFELKQNFRSVPDILHVVNEVFDAIMSNEYADIEYDESHQLNPGRPSYEETSGSPVTLILANDTWGEEETELSDQDDSEEKAIDGQDADKIEKEALIAAKRILELAKLPDFSYRDCAILTTSNHAAMKAAEVLMKRGIPAQGPASGNILKHPDLRIMIELARLTDNGFLDLSLACVMKSKIQQASFSDEDLLNISLFADASNKGGLPFCEKVAYFAEHAEGELAARVQSFQDFLLTLRTYAMQMSVAKWIEHVYALTNYTNWVLTQRDGEARYYALMALINWSERFDHSRNVGLRAFVDYVEEMDAQKDASTDIELSASLENVVKCMTIHKSKGLEFPYVFLCGMQNPGKKDTTRILLSESGEMACVRYCPQWQSRYEPHDFFLLKEEEERESDAEKIRLLYVAMTRAEKKLFVIATVKRTVDDVISGYEPAVIEALQKFGEGKLTRTMMWSLSDHLKKMLAGLVRNHGEIAGVILKNEPVQKGDLDFSLPKREKDSANLAVLADNGHAIADNITISGESSEEAYKRARNMLLSGAIEEPILQDDVCVRLEQMKKTDDFAPIRLVPAKSTVSEMKRLLAQEETDEDAQEGVSAEAINLRLREADEKWKMNGYSATQMGTLIHSAWQYIDFAGLCERGTEVDWKRELERLCEYGMITGEQVELLNQFAPAMQKFLEHPLCREIAMAETREGCGPFREIPFALAVTDFDVRDSVDMKAGMLNGENISERDYTLVQGMIDCWFIDQNDEAVLIDYKSDRISGSEIEKEQVLRERYWKQLDLYARAITAATGKKVSRRIIWLIRDGRLYEL